MSTARERRVTEADQAIARILLSEGRVARAEHDGLRAKGPCQRVRGAQIGITDRAVLIVPRAYRPAAARALPSSLGCPTRRRQYWVERSRERRPWGYDPAESLMLQIAVINESSAIIDREVQGMIPAFTAQWNNELNTIWGVGAAEFAFCAKGSPPPQRSWWAVFLDDSNQADALAYHDLTDEGLPISKVFVPGSRATFARIALELQH